MFDIDNEIVTYKSIDECIEKVKWLLKNPLESKKIALAGQARTLKDHSVENRVKIVDQALRERFEKK